MVEWLAKKYIPDRDNVKDATVRQQYGVLSGTLGIVLNIILFIGKLTVGFISGSVAITADALNNLSDAGSSVVMFVGFKMAGQKPDPDHPFGHGRIEYVTGFVVSMMIVLMGVELGKSSIAKIIHPQIPGISIATLLVLVISILVKLYMFLYNKRLSIKLSSVTMNATAMDSVTDAFATFVVFIAMILCYFMGINLDGWCGLLAALFVLYTGITSAKDTLDPLLGTKADPEYVKTIEKFVTSFDGILGIHDLVIHDYGPGRTMITLHAEVPSTVDVVQMHDTIDNIERRLSETLGCYSTIHMDPIVVNDEENERMKRLSTLIAKSVDESLTIHDFRMVKGATHTNLIFDVVVPYDVKLTENEVRQLICTKVESLPGNHFAVVQIDRPYV